MRGEKRRLLRGSRDFIHKKTFVSAPFVSFFVFVLYFSPRSINQSIVHLFSTLSSHTLHCPLTESGHCRSSPSRSTCSPLQTVSAQVALTQIGSHSRRSCSSSKILSRKHRDEYQKVEGDDQQRLKGSNSEGSSGAVCRWQKGTQGGITCERKGKKGRKSKKGICELEAIFFIVGKDFFIYGAPIFFYTQNFFFSDKIFERLCFYEQ